MSVMVLEIALIEINEGSESAFEAAFSEAEARLQGAAGLNSAELARCIERPSHYVLVVDWESVAAHEAFRETPAFAEWRGLVGPHLASPPSASHYSPLGGR